MYIETIWKAVEVSMCVAGLSSCFFYKNLDSHYRFINIYIWLGVLIDLLTTYFMKSTGYNLFLLPIYSFAELAIFSSIYLRFFLKGENAVLKSLLLLAHGLILLDFLFLCDLFNAETFYAFSKVVADIAIVVLCLKYFSNILKEETPIKKELLLLNSVFIGYFSINSIIFLSINFLVNESLDLVTPFWVLNALSALFLYSFLTYMIWQHGRTQKTLPSG
jgi:hypothetical protein